MTCDDLRSRLLALPDPVRPPADLRPHLAECPGCAAVLTALAGIESAITRLPVPDGSAAKAAFLARFAEPPIIVLAPAPHRRESFRWPHVAGLAAGVCLAVGGWLATRPGPEQPRVAARHDLLQKEVGSVVKLTKAGSAAERMVLWADAAADFQGEMAVVYQVAPAYDLDALAKMFVRAVDEGVVAQAEKLPEFLPPKDRHDRLIETANKLAGVEAEANRLSDTARPAAKPYLERMVRTAKDGKDKLEQLARGKA